MPFKRCPYENDFFPINLGDLNIILGSWNGFTANFRESYEGLFFLNYDFWKCGFWSRGWGLRALFVSTGLWQHLRLKKLNLVHFFSRYYLFRFIWYWTGSKPSPSLLSPFSFLFLGFFSVGAATLSFSDFFVIVWEVFWSIFSDVAPFSQMLFQTSWKKSAKKRLFDWDHCRRSWYTWKESEIIGKLLFLFLCCSN